MKQKAYPGSLYDLWGVEKWLEDLSAHGLQLEEFSNLGKLAKLQETPPVRRRYYLEPDFDQYGSDEAEKVYVEQGWTYVCEVSGVFLVYESEDPWASRPQGWQPQEKQLRKKWRNLWLDLIIWVVGLGLGGWNGVKLVRSLWEFDTSYYDTLTGLWLMLIPVALTFLLEFWIGSTKSYDLLIWRKCVRRQEKAERRKILKVLRWGEYYIVPVVAVGAILVALFANSVGSRTYIPIWRQDRVLPMVTLDVTEEEIYFAPEPYGPSINVSFMRRLLIPQDIHIDSYGLYENPGDVEAWRKKTITRGSADAELRFAYYRLWTEGMAIRLAEDFASDWELECVENGDFDALWSGERPYGGEYLVAREGDIVITVIYDGESALEPHIDEIYEIVMDYRNR